MEIQNIILIIFSILLLGLSFYVLFRNPKDPINISFFVMVLGGVVWVLTNAIFRETQSLFWGKIKQRKILKIKLKWPPSLSN